MSNTYVAFKRHVGSYQSSLTGLVWGDSKICVNTAALRKKAHPWLMRIPTGLLGSKISCLCSQTSVIHYLETVKMNLSCKILK